MDILPAQTAQPEASPYRALPRLRQRVRELKLAPLWALPRLDGSLTPLHQRARQGGTGVRPVARSAVDTLPAKTAQPEASPHRALPRLRQRVRELKLAPLWALSRLGGSLTPLHQRTRQGGTGVPPVARSAVDTLPAKTAQPEASPYRALPRLRQRVRELKLAPLWALPRLAGSLTPLHQRARQGQGTGVPPVCVAHRTKEACQRRAGRAECRGHPSREDGSAGGFAPVCPAWA